MLVTKRVDFSASHICRNPAFSGPRNEEIYGAAANPHGHGHNYVLDITLQGEPDPVTGMVFDLKALKEILTSHVIKRFDHRFLNYECPPFDRVVPTAENFAVEIWNTLAPVLGGKLHSVRLYETQDMFVEYFGEAL